MAASMTIRWKNAEIFSVYLIYVACILANCDLYTLRPQDVLDKVENSCFIGVTKESDVDLLGRFAQLADVFAEEERVSVGIVHLHQQEFKSEKINIEIDGVDCEKDKTNAYLNCQSEITDIVFFPKIKRDRTCLLPSKKKHLKGEIFLGPSSLDVLVSFVNVKCGTFYKTESGLTSQGIHRQHILDNLYHVSEVSDMTMTKLYSSENNPLNKSFGISEKIDVCENDKGCYSNRQNVNKYVKNYPTEIPTCPTIELPLSRDEFVSDYLMRSRPVIIKGAVKEWPAFEKWTQEFLREKYGEKRVHVKLTPGGDFEGVERADQWENYESFKIPDAVKEQLPYPDLVVVRPAGISMKFSEFLDLITWAASQPERNVSAYLEYSSIPEYMPELEEDLLEFDFVKDLLTRRHLNMWLSDGNTLGRLHFDPFDNFLCQMRGRKQVILFEPYDNQKLYEGHIPQATLGYSREDHRFRRKTLEDSTSMVMSPVDLLKPDLQRFPKFGDAQPLNCTIDEGDALFMPSFWWHEVYSWPNADEKRNLAVNFWYEPFLTKEFPCPECKLDVNSFYHHLL